MDNYSYPLPYGTPLTHTHLPTKPIRVVGIDLGTTNCTVAEIVFDPARAGPVKTVCKPIRQGGLGAGADVMVPSVVALHEGKIFVGRAARDLPKMVPGFTPHLYRNFFRDCKNYMGLRRSFHQAPQGFRHARDIAGQLLRFLLKGLGGQGKPDAVVITIPASFQLAQRRDTVLAVEQAMRRRGGRQAKGQSSPVEQVRLLDEPLAAFLDFAATNGLACLGEPGQTKNLLVFDFGGGTCDTALYRVTIPEPGHPMQVAPLAVSRYHRLGGTDIDLAIVHEALLPQLCRQNGIERLDIGYEDIQERLVPVLLPPAERLRIRLCELEREAAGKAAMPSVSVGDDHSGGEVFQVDLNESISCTLMDGRTICLDGPVLSKADLDKILAPFLDEDVIWPRESEFRTTCSLFAPIGDVLRRARMTVAGVDGVLLAGGCCRMVQIRRAISNHFPKARLYAPTDPASIQLAVARGAAYEALFQTLFGRGVVVPVAGDELFLNTTSGPVKLMERGAHLPFPSPELQPSSLDCLAVPENAGSSKVDLRVEIADSSGQCLDRRLWQIPESVQPGEPLRLSYHMDANQNLHMQLRLARAPEPAFTCTMENPLVNMVNSDLKRERIQELEEQRHGGLLRGTQLRRVLDELIDLHWKLGHLNQALSICKDIIDRFGPGYDVLNRMGLIYRQLRFFDRAERYFRLAQEQLPNGVPLFNLALTLDDQGRTQEALQAAKEALQHTQAAPYHVLCAKLAAKTGNTVERKEHLDKASASLSDVECMNDWELDWGESLASMRGDEEMQENLRKERQRRQENQSEDAPGWLPDWVVRDNNHAGQYPQMALEIREHQG